MPEITRHAIRSWIETVATGEFHYSNVLGLRNKLDHDQDAMLRKVIWECSHGSNPVCESTGRNDGVYRPIENHALPLEWQDIEERKDSGLILPFDLRRWVFIYPDTTTVVAGSKSSGKTGFLYRAVVLNMNRVNTVLLTNLEGGLPSLRDRFFAMDVTIPKPAPFKVKNVTENFHDYIKERDTLYVIDYIDAPEGMDFFLIGASIQKVDRKLQGLNSVAIVGLQKPSSRDTAFGGEGTLKAATLYLAMDTSRIKVVDAKVPEDPTAHPKNMQWTFQYSDKGTKFLNIQQSYDSRE